MLIIIAENWEKKLIASRVPEESLWNLNELINSKMSLFRFVMKHSDSGRSVEFVTKV